MKLDLSNEEAVLLMEALDHRAYVLQEGISALQRIFNSGALPLEVQQAVAPITSEAANQIDRLNRKIREELNRE